MSKETEFFIYLLERYAAYKEKTAPQVLKEWDKLDLTDFIYDMYEIYHVERLQNAFDDIEQMMTEKNNRIVTSSKGSLATGKHAW
jgi:hypothetical protein